MHRVIREVPVGDAGDVGAVAASVIGRIMSNFSPDKLRSLKEPGRRTCEAWKGA